MRNDHRERRSTPVAVGDASTENTHLTVTGHGDTLLPWSEKQQQNVNGPSAYAERDLV